MDTSFCYNKSDLSVKYNIITPLRTEFSPEKKSAKIHPTPKELMRLKDELTPEQQKAVLKERLSGDAKSALGDIDSFQRFESVLSDEEGSKKKLGLPLLVGLLAWYLKPEVKDEDKKEQKDKAEKKDDKA